MKSILEQVKNELKPPLEEEKKVYLMDNQIVNKINKGLRFAKAVIGGSGAKSTWLKDAHDSDIFVMYNLKKYKEKNDQLSDLLEKHLKKSFRKILRIHGSRDYFQIVDKNHTFEIIPILDILRAEQARNITDISPLHTKFVKRYGKLADEVRLTKKFCKAIRVYGAESYIQGFSGYVCELLTIHFKSFYNLVKAAAKWQDRVIIDIAKHHKSVDLEVNKSKLSSPLILIDPVQAGRNASAALSKENFERFKSSCLNFIKSPSKDMFIEKKIDFDKLKRNEKDTVIIIKVLPFSGKRDVIGTKLLKSFQFLEKSIKVHNFEIVKSDWEWDKKDDAIFYFIVKNRMLPETYEWLGPPVKAKNHVKIFKKKYKNTFIKNGRVYAKVKTQYRDAFKFMIHILADDYLKDKVKGVKKIG